MRAVAAKLRDASILCSSQYDNARSLSFHVIRQSSRESGEAKTMLKGVLAKM